MHPLKSKLLFSCLIMGLTIFSVESYAHDHPSCPELTKNMSSWNQPLKISSAKTGAELPNTLIPVHKTIDAALSPARSIKFIVNPEERGGSVSFAGMVQFDIVTQSTYRIITNSRPWIEIVKDGKIIESTKHQHGEACLGVEKILDFPLSPGRYTMEMTGNGKESIKFIIVPIAK